MTAKTKAIVYIICFLLFAIGAWPIADHLDRKHKDVLVAQMVATGTTSTNAVCAVYGFYSVHNAYICGMVTEAEKRR